MSEQLKSNVVVSLQRERTTWGNWAWLAFAAAVVVAMVVGFLRAGRPFWHLACDQPHSLSSQRA